MVPEPFETAEHMDDDFGFVTKKAKKNISSRTSRHIKKTVKINTDRRLMSPQNDNVDEGLDDFEHYVSYKKEFSPLFKYKSPTKIDDTPFSPTSTT